MRVLVTGHQGYIGTVMVPMLQADGHEVVGLDSGLFVDSTFQPVWHRLAEMNKDIRDVEPADLDGFDAVIHLAGLCNDPLGDLAPQLTQDINHVASVRLASLAKACRVKRFVFSSSCSNYGSGGDAWVDERSPQVPLTPYAKSKLAVERDVMQLADDDFSPVFLRNATAYGVSPRLRFDLVLNNLMAWAMTTKQIYLKSDGTPWRPLVHVEDIVRAFIAVLDAPRDVIHNQVFNVGRTEDNYRISELSEIVADAVPGSTIVYAPDAGPDTRNYRVDCSKITDALPGFQPQWTARKGALELSAAYRAAGVTLEEFEGPRYQRLAHIQQMLSDGLIDQSLRWTSAEASATCRAP